MVEYNSTIDIFKQPNITDKHLGVVECITNADIYGFSGQNGIAKLWMALADVISRLGELEEHGS